MRKELVERSKFLSLVLRHDPGSIGVALDAQGWVDVGALLRAATERGTPLSRDELLEIVATNPKRRFDLDVTGDRIRRDQGVMAFDVRMEFVIVARRTSNALTPWNCGVRLGELQPTTR